jgi:hypothetical protein
LIEKSKPIKNKIKIMFILKISNKDKKNNLFIERCKGFEIFITLNKITLINNSEIQPSNIFGKKGKNARTNESMIEFVIKISVINNAT